MGSLYTSLKRSAQMKSSGVSFLGRSEEHISMKTDQASFHHRHKAYFIVLSTSSR